MSIQYKIQSGVNIQEPIPLALELGHEISVKHRTGIYYDDDDDDDDDNKWFIVIIIMMGDDNDDDGNNDDHERF